MGFADHWKCCIFEEYGVYLFRQFSTRVQSEGMNLSHIILSENVYPTQIGKASESILVSGNEKEKALFAITLDDHGAFVKGETSKICDCPDTTAEVHEDSGK